MPFRENIDNIFGGSFNQKYFTIFFFLWSKRFSVFPYGTKIPDYVKVEKITLLCLLNCELINSVDEAFGINIFHVLNKCYVCHVQTEFQLRVYSAYQPNSVSVASLCPLQFTPYTRFLEDSLKFCLMLAAWPNVCSNLASVVMCESDYEIGCNLVKLYK